MNIQAMMKQAQKLQKDMMNEKEKIDNTEYIGTSSFVTVKMMGNKQIKEVKIDMDSIDKEEIELLQDMLVVAINQAIKKIDDDLPLIENNMPKPVSNFVGKSFEEQKPLNSEVVIEENKATKNINNLIREKTDKILSESEVFEAYKSFSTSSNFHDSPIMSKLLDKQL